MLEHGTRHIRELTGSACERILRNGRNSRALSRSQIRSSTNVSETILIYRGVLSTQYVCDIGNARKNKILSMWRESERGLDNTISKMVHILRLKLSGILMLWTKQPWVCRLPWKTHTPIPSKDKIRRVCAACGTYRLDGTKYVSYKFSDPVLQS
jgi:hypothetical protein